MPLSVRDAIVALLSELLLLPGQCAVATAHLATSRLAALLPVALPGSRGAGSATNSRKGKRSSGHPDLSLEAESLATSLCACLRLLTAHDSADAYRVAATGGALAALVMLTEQARPARLRQNARVSSMPGAVGAGVMSCVCVWPCL